VGTQREDWALVVDQVLAGDEVACLKLGRLITGFLSRWRAYDFREEWPDLTQEVLLAIVKGAKQGRIRDRNAMYGYVRTVTRNKFADRLKRHLGQSEDATLEWEEATESAPGELPTYPARDDIIVDVRLALEKLPENKRRIVFGVYGEGKTYEQVSSESGVPLGTVKRYLRDGLAELRSVFDAALESQ
jgi:RNA polymerase sigma-70 factor (ECF subfamily)